MHDGLISNEEYRLHLLNAIPEKDWEYEEKGEHEKGATIDEGQNNVKDKKGPAGMSSAKSSNQALTITKVTPTKKASPEMSFTTEDNTPLILLKPHMKPVSGLQEGDYVLINPGKSTGQTFKGCIEKLDPLEVRYYRLHKGNDASAGWVANDIVHPCTREEIAHIIEKPVPLDPSRKCRPVKFPELQSK